MEVRKGWTILGAENFLGEIQGVLASLDVTAKIVGSVATRGRSENDLDVLLQPVRPMSLVEVIGAVESGLLKHISNDTTVNPMESGCQEETWFLPVLLFDGRLVEFYLPESEFPLEPLDGTKGNEMSCGM